MRYFSKGVGASADGSSSGRRASVLRLLALLLAVILAGTAILSARSNAQSGPDSARKTSAYDDPAKPVLSYITEAAGFLKRKA